MTIERKLNKLVALQKQLEPPKQLYGTPITPPGQPYDGRYDEYWLSQGRTFRPLIIHPSDLPSGLTGDVYAIKEELPL